MVRGRMGPGFGRAMSGPLSSECSGYLARRRSQSRSITPSRRERNVVCPYHRSLPVAVAGLKRSRWWAGIGPPVAEHHEDRPEVSTRRRCSAKRDDSDALQLKCAKRGTQSFRQLRQRNLQ